MMRIRIRRRSKGGREGKRLLGMMGSLGEIFLYALREDTGDWSFWGGMRRNLKTTERRQMGARGR